MPKRIQHYRQLTQGQRYQIQALHDNGFSQRKIASRIGVNHSTVSRELKRNKTCKRYCAQTAHTLKDKRKRLSRKYTKYHEQPAKVLYDALLMGWSPEKLSLRMKLEIPEWRLSHPTLYRRIAADKTQGGSLHTKLPRFGKSRFKGGKRNSGRTLIPNRIDIIQRPQVVAERSRMGDWEGDTIHGKNAYLVTLAQRRSRLVLMGKVVDKQATTVAQCLSELLRRVDNAHTITLDNGGEFSHDDQVAKTSGVTIYFAKPYASYQRGTNENTNGLIRRFWPKGTDCKPLDKIEIRNREECCTHCVNSETYQKEIENLN